MKRSIKTRLLLLGCLALPGAAFAAPRTVTLEVPGMTCSACPITVKKALKNVAGVEKVAVTYEPKEAVVTFDDSKTSIERLEEATRNAGYPSSAKSSARGAKN